jgi:AraC-like DNA-binding protein
MTETPSFVAETPLSPMARDGDALSEILRGVRLTGTFFVDARLSGPFRVLSPQRFDAGEPMAHLRHVSAFHYIAAGSGTLTTAAGLRREVVAGDLLLLPFADQHVFEGGVRAPGKTVDTSDVMIRGPVEGIWRLTHDGGSGGGETRVLCGFIESAEVMFSPLFRTLPELLVERADDASIGVPLTGTVADLLQRMDMIGPGSEAIFSRIVELLFVEILRRYVGRLPAGSMGLLAALADPIAGRALKLIHAAPARRWTADSLAREAGSSRTVLGERFNALIGKPPIEYLIGWRIQLAADRLRHGRDGIARIAGDIGYESEAAFNRAFKRVTGMSPGKWRDGGGDSPPHMPIYFSQPLGPA